MERRGHHGLIRESVKGQDIEPDRVVSTRMYVTLEDHQKKMKANDDALRWRSRRTYIVEALLGIMIFVAIVMAGISLQKIDKTAEDLTQLNKTVSYLEEQLKEVLSRTLSNCQMEILKTNLTKQCH